MSDTAFACDVILGDEGEYLPENILEQVNRVTPKTRTLGEDDVFVRTMYVASDKVNSQGGRFDTDGMKALVCLIPGAPVLVGHDKSRLPIARCASAELVRRDGDPWVKVWFFWLRSTSGAKDLRDNIDAGIYTECSLGFSFGLPRCSICDGDIRRCSHVPGRTYDSEVKSNITCHFVYSEVTRVNEISLVYRGAVPGTSISRQFHKSESMSELQQDLCRSSVPVLLNLDQLNLPGSGCIVTSVYHGEPLDIDALMSEASRFQTLEPALKRLSGLSRRFKLERAIVTPYRGRSRLPMWLHRSLREQRYKNPVRLRLKVLFGEDCAGNLPDDEIVALNDNGVDISFPRRTHDIQDIRQLLTGSPKEGLLITCGDGSVVVRSSPLFQMRVVSVSRTRSDKFCYNLEFNDSEIGSYRSYESGIEASEGDVLLIRAEPDLSPSGMHLRRLRVIDNLYDTAREDAGVVACFPAMKLMDRFDILDLGGNARLLRISYGTTTRFILFPQYSERALLRNGTLVGYSISCDAPLRSVIVDSGSVTSAVQGEKGFCAAFKGRTLNDRYIIRSAMVHGDPVELLYRAPRC